MNKFHFRVSGAYDKAIDCKFDLTDDRKLRNGGRPVTRCN